MKVNTGKGTWKAWVTTRNDTGATQAFQMPLIQGSYIHDIARPWKASIWGHINLY